MTKIAGRKPNVRFPEFVDAEWLIQKYRNEKLSVLKIANLLGVGRQSVSVRMVSFGIDRRPSTQSNYLDRTSYESCLSSLWVKYKDGARLRNYDWGLTLPEFEKLVFSPCHYCGDKGSLSKTTKSETHRFNGIDRVNSSLGYIPSNCLPCCKSCNYAKREMSYDEFLEFIKRIYRHLSL